MFYTDVMDATLLFYLVYFLAGLLAGIIAGMLGLGGGVVLVPVLFFMFTAQGYADSVVIKLATATSLATIVGTGMSSAVSHYRLGSVQLQWLYWLAPGIVVGAVLGMVLVDVLDAFWVTMVFAVGELVVAARMGLFASQSSVDEPVTHAMTDKHLLALLPAGLFIGTVSSLAGIGGGVLTVPLLVGLAGVVRPAIGTSAVVGLCIAIPGVISAVTFGLNETDLPENTWGYVVWPVALAIMAGSILTAPLGAKLAQRLPVARLKQCFALVLVIAGLRMMWAVIAA